jgi:hypothetical protein
MGTKCTIFIDDLPRMLPTKFWFIWQSGFREEDFFVNRSEINEQFYWGPSKDASYQNSIHLAKRLQRRRFFRNQPIRNKNCLWQPCLLTDQDEMSNLYRRPAIDTSYQVSVHLAKRFQRRRLLKITQSETKIAYGDHVC